MALDSLLRSRYRWAKCCSISQTSPMERKRYQYQWVTCSYRTAQHVLNGCELPLMCYLSLSHTHAPSFPQCINTHGSFGPDSFEYITERTHEPDVHIPTNSEFLVCCSCTDNCANRSRCECWQLTTQESKVVPGEGRFSVGYVHQKLNRPQHSA